MGSAARGHHRVQVLDNDGLAALFEYLREITRASPRLLVLGTVNPEWLYDSHGVKAYERIGAHVCALVHRTGWYVVAEAFYGLAIFPVPGKSIAAEFVRVRGAMEWMSAFVTS